MSNAVIKPYSRLIEVPKGTLRGMAMQDDVLCPSFAGEPLLSAILLLTSLPALAASGVELSIYQSRNEVGFRSSSNGLAIVHERRVVLLKTGPQELTLDGFPQHFDLRERIGSIFIFSS